MTLSLSSHVPVGICDALVHRAFVGTHFRTHFVVQVIGKGSFGKVMLVRKNDTQRIYAMKVLYKDNVIKRNQVCPHFHISSPCICRHTPVVPLPPYYHPSRSIFACSLTFPPFPSSLELVAHTVACRCWYRWSTRARSGTCWSMSVILSSSPSDTPSKLHVGAHQRTLRRLKNALDAHELALHCAQTPTRRRKCICRQIVFCFGLLSGGGAILPPWEGRVSFLRHTHSRSLCTPACKHHPHICSTSTRANISMLTVLRSNSESRIIAKLKLCHWISN